MRWVLMVRLVAVRRTRRRSNGTSIRVDRDDLGHTVRNAHRVKDFGEQDPTSTQIGFIVANANVMKRVAAQHGDFDGSGRYGELVEPAGCTKCRP